MKTEELITTIGNIAFNKINITAPIDTLKQVESNLSEAACKISESGEGLTIKEEILARSKTPDELEENCRYLDKRLHPTYNKLIGISRRAEAILDFTDQEEVFAYDLEENVKTLRKIEKKAAEVNDNLRKLCASGKKMRTEKKATPLVEMGLPDYEYFNESISAKIGCEFKKQFLFDPTAYEALNRPGKGKGKVSIRNNERGRAGYLINIMHRYLMCHANVSKASADAWRSAFCYALGVDVKKVTHQGIKGSGAEQDSTYHNDFIRKAKELFGI